MSKLISQHGKTKQSGINPRAWKPFTHLYIYRNAQDKYEVGFILKAWGIISLKVGWLNAYLIISTCIFYINDYT